MRAYVHIVVRVSLRKKSRLVYKKGSQCDAPHLFRAAVGPEERSAHRDQSLSRRETHSTARCQRTTIRNRSGGGGIEIQLQGGGEIAKKSLLRRLNVRNVINGGAAAVE